MSNIFINKILKYIAQEAPKWGTEEYTLTSSEISSGWQAPRDGVMMLRCNSSGGYNYFYSTHGQIQIQGGLSQTTCHPIRKGEIFQLTASADATRCWAWFFPLSMGGPAV